MQFTKNKIVVFSAVAIIAIILLLVFFSRSFRPKADQPGGSSTTVVFEKVDFMGKLTTIDNQPFYGLVSIYVSNDDIRTEYTSSEDGIFEFPDLPKGIYNYSIIDTSGNIWATASDVEHIFEVSPANDHIEINDLKNYGPSQISAAPVSTAPTPTPSASQTPAAVAKKQYTITGKVLQKKKTTDKNGQNVKNATVTLYLSDTSEKIAETKTTSSGYSFSNIQVIPDGKYYLSVSETKQYKSGRTDIIINSNPSSAKIDNTNIIVIKK